MFQWCCRPWSIWTSFWQLIFWRWMGDFLSVLSVIILTIERTMLRGTLRRTMLKWLFSVTYVTRSRLHGMPCTTTKRKCILVLSEGNISSYHLYDSWFIPVKKVESKACKCNLVFLWLVIVFLWIKEQLQNINLTHYFQSLWSKIGWLCTLRSRPFVLWRMVSSIGAVGSVKSTIETSVTFSDISKLLILKQTHTPVRTVPQNSRLDDHCKDMNMQCISKKQNPRLLLAHNLWMLKSIVLVRDFV